MFSYLLNATYLNGKNQNFKQLAVSHFGREAKEKHTTEVDLPKVYLGEN